MVIAYRIAYERNILMFHHFIQVIFIQFKKPNCLRCNYVSSDSSHIAAKYTLISYFRINLNIFNVRAIKHWESMPFCQMERWQTVGWQTYFYICLKKKMIIFSVFVRNNWEPFDRACTFLISVETHDV